MPGKFAMRCSLLVSAAVVAWVVVAAAQGPTYKLGRPPTEFELYPRDAHIAPNGEGLPPGHGTAKQGATVYLARGCGACHGPTGEEGPGPYLAGPQQFARSSSGRLPAPREATATHDDHGEVPSGAWGVQKFKTAPLLWSWINLAMPLEKLGYIVLTPDEVYSLAAYILYRNDMIRESDVMDAKTLPQVKMPFRDEYPPFPYKEWKPGLRPTSR